MTQDEENQAVEQAVASVQAMIGSKERLREVIHDAIIAGLLSSSDLFALANVASDIENGG